ncbi:NifB/NifX family molybdenum-iron cluster-binding protein [Novipirellula artificiosorum]|uniref:Dinitrogenase iron-molybdenum cofactor n=1 Tax=Novipirellula artificiosorum TaxID=2528016 RepID=A0A5C6E4V4_9BACT|nr:NifB/NifX family molybdenum-iron cluster-binding protein [Novipirellula artificiosorum]TWU42611.1 Dinitrogenase iron-molybdenum cofactor [Novipirellula artificiosorum]
MKIAVASSDGVLISKHFGRSSCFIVFETQGEAIIRESVRENRQTAHAKGHCTGDHDHHDGDDHPVHSHDDIAMALSDCTIVLCYGMGWRAAEALRQSGTQPFVVDGEMTPRQAVLQYLAGQLKSASDFCRCH